MLLLLLALGPLLISSAHAEELDELQRSSIDTDALEEAAPEILEGVDALGLTDLTEVVGRLKDQVTGSIGAILRSSVRSGALLLLIVLLCSLADSLSGLGEGMSTQTVRLAGAGAVALVALSDMSSLIGLGRETIEQLSAFTTILMPTMTTAAAASGSAVSAPVKQAATLLFSNLLTSLVSSLLLPMTLGYAALCIACAALGSGRLQPLCKLLRWAVMTILTGILLVYTGYLTISGAVATTADAAAVKAAQMAISGFVPVVGSILSDATGAVLSGASLLRSSIGIFGVIGVLGFCLVPFLRLGVQFLLYKLVAALSAALSDHPVSGLIQDLSSVFSLVMGMTGTCALVVLLSLISVISAVTP